MIIGTLPPADLFNGKELADLKSAINTAIEAREAAALARNELNILAERADHVPSDDERVRRRDKALALGRAKAARAGQEYQPTQWEQEQVRMAELRALVPQLEAHAEALSEEIRYVHAAIAPPLRPKNYERALKAMEAAKAARHAVIAADAEVSRLIAFDHWLLATASDPDAPGRIDYQESPRLELPPRNFPNGDD